MDARALCRHPPRAVFYVAEVLDEDELARFPRAPVDALSFDEVRGSRRAHEVGSDRAGVAVEAERRRRFVQLPVGSVLPVEGFSHAIVGRADRRFAGVGGEHVGDDLHRQRRVVGGLRGASARRRCGARARRRFRTRRARGGARGRGGRDALANGGRSGSGLGHDGFLRSSNRPLKNGLLAFHLGEVCTSPPRKTRFFGVPTPRNWLRQLLSGCFSTPC